MKGVDFVFDEVTEIDPDQKVIKFRSKPDLSYRVCIVATGSKMPLIMPKPGDTVEQRVQEVRRVGAAIARAQTIVVNGAGLVGLEMAGDVRAKHPDKRVVLLSRDGRVLGNSHPPQWQERVKKVLEKMKIEVITGGVPKNVLKGGTEPALEAGTITLETGNIVTYDVFIPAFSQEPNTQFLAHTKALNERKLIVANECLQSTVYPEILGINVTTVTTTVQPVIAVMTARAKTCAMNAKLILDGKPPVPHKHSGPAMERPPTVKIGHGRGGYMIWDEEMLPCPLKCLCCLPCGGGFPCCPPPCCWCCGSGCSNCFGNCCGPAEGEGSAIFMLEFMLPKFPGSHGFKGLGKPMQQKM